MLPVWQGDALREAVADGNAVGPLGLQAEGVSDRAAEDHPPDAGS